MSEDQQCQFSCSREAVYELTYDEQGTPTKRKLACTEHKNVETIHDPFNVQAEAI